MASDLSQLMSPAAVQAALDEFSRAGRSDFLKAYGFGKSRDYMVRNPATGDLCDSKAIVGAAYGNQYPERGPLTPAEFSGGEATVVAKLQSLGFEVVRIGEDWSLEEVNAVTSSYFEMLALEARQVAYNKSEFNAAVRKHLRGRSKSSVELKHQNISAVMQTLELPFISGYKPRGNAQLLLRKVVQAFVLEHSDLMRQVVDAMEEVKPSETRTFKAVLVEPPSMERVVTYSSGVARARFPRKMDYVMRDEANRRLGRAGEQWVLEFEQQRLRAQGEHELFQRVDWVADRLGDGAGYDILSYDTPLKPRYIEVKTTNGPHASSFVISRNELEFSKEAEDAFHLYRVFQFRESPCLYILNGDVSKHLHLEPMDYRASFRQMIGGQS